ncbi:maleylacetate reductase [Planktotalea frisia]|nr:maleylacetate reductase [Planktotalea frisia]MDB9810195.1 maleylacetate reductase [Planktomarina temperata]
MRKQDAFVYTGLPARVVFGYGTIQYVAREADALGMQRALVLTTETSRHKGEDVSDRLGKLSAGVYSGAKMHTPVEGTDAAMEHFKSIGADGIVAIGGGSTIGLGKAIALRTDCPQLVIPTTYAGSEMTPNLGQTENGIKTVTSSPKILPETVIYEVELTHSLAPKISAASGMNAIAHAAEALYAKDTNPIVRLMAIEGISSLRSALPKIVSDPNDRQARFTALYGAWLCSALLAQASVALHHQICHAIGGAFNTSHADTHANILPYAIAYNSRIPGTAMDDLAAALGAEQAAQGLYLLNEDLGIRSSLKDLGVPADGVDTIVEQIVAKPYWNPRAINRGALQNTLKGAWHGDPPEYEADA